MRILFVYFALFVLFCAANQYSWLQPLTGFRYLVPVVPALALLAMHPRSALPPVVRWLIAGAACAQSLLMAVSHENNFRSALVTFWRHRGTLLSIIRLGDAGIHVTWMLPAFTWIAVAIACLWYPAGRRPSSVPSPTRREQDCAIAGKFNEFLDHKQPVLLTLPPAFFLQGL